jgi:hypothetical protein
MKCTDCVYNGLIYTIRRVKIYRNILLWFKWVLTAFSGGFKGVLWGLHARTALGLQLVPSIIENIAP